MFLFSSNQGALREASNLGAFGNGGQRNARSGLNEQLLQVSNTLLSYYLNAEAVWEAWRITVDAGEKV
jgi:hypothetical protein